MKKISLAQNFLTNNTTSKNNPSYLSQKNLFDDNEIETYINLESRRYIGNKSKLSYWIMKIIENEIKNATSFLDLFAGTGVISKAALQKYERIIINDFLYSNHIIYKAFFKREYWDKDKLLNFISHYNMLNGRFLNDNYFSINFGDKFFNYDVSKKIGFIRDDIEKNRDILNDKEYSILLASLIYSMDKIANTVGHFDAYIKKDIKKTELNMKLIKPEVSKGTIEIYRMDANILAKRIKADIAYIDPPYNSRQYSRFYHIYETLIKWDKPKLFGVALKPRPENMSKYCTVKAKDVFEDLINSLNVNYIVVSYNNTYKSKSNSSKNKIKLEQIENILNKVGKTKIFEQSYKFFNTGKTSFHNHKEYLFLTEKKIKK